MLSSYVLALESYRIKKGECSMKWTDGKYSKKIRNILLTLYLFVKINLKDLPRILENYRQI